MDGVANGEDRSVARLNQRRRIGHYHGAPNRWSQGWVGDRCFKLMANGMGEFGKDHGDQTKQDAG